MRKRPEIEVTTRHSYEIEYKYQWSKPTTSLLFAQKLNCRLFIRMLELRQDVSLRGALLCPSPRAPTHPNEQIWPPFQVA